MAGKRTLTKEAPASSAAAKSTWVMPVIQIFLIVAGLAGLAFHAFPVRTNQYYDNWPLFDLTALAWLVPIVVAMLLPNISEVTWGPLSLKVRELKSASEVYEVSLDNLANLVQNWSTSAAMYVAKMGQREEDLLEAKDAIYADYVRDRMGEAYEMVATKPSQILRLGLWLYDPLTDDIVFALGFRLTPKVQRYKPGEGMIGKSFTENRHFNEADVRNVPSYKPNREDDDPPYKAVLCEPVRWNDEPIGIITVDRSEAGFFDYVAEQVAQGLASQCALAVKVYEASQAAASTSSRDEPVPEPG